MFPSIFHGASLRVATFYSIQLIAHILRLCITPLYTMHIACSSSATVTCITSKGDNHHFSRVQVSYLVSFAGIQALQIENYFHWFHSVGNPPIIYQFSAILKTHLTFSICPASLHMNQISRNLTVVTIWRESDPIPRGRTVWHTSR
jgi:hypothetical protein